MDKLAESWGRGEGCETRDYLLWVIVLPRVLELYQPLLTYRSSVSMRP
jgi:hypothetical protein